jgi:hypothetical protein
MLESAEFRDRKASTATTRDLHQKDCYQGGEDSFAGTGRCAKSRCYPPRTPNGAHKPNAKC